MLTTDRKLKKNANFLRWVKKNNGWISFCLKHLFDQHYHVPVEKKKKKSEKWTTNQDQRLCRTRSI